jgi:hypothetical protein
MVDQSPRGGASAHRAQAPLPLAAPSTSRRGALAALAGVLAGSADLLNLPAGLIEFLPDNMPFIGNLDEAGATGMVIYGLQYLGRRKREREARRETPI